MESVIQGTSKNNTGTLIIATAVSDKHFFNSDPGVLCLLTASIKPSD